MTRFARARFANTTLLFGIALLATGPAKAGLLSNPTFDDASFVSAGFNVADVHNGFNVAAQEIENLFSDNIHVNITVRAGVTGLGASSTALLGTLTYASTRAVLINDQTLHPSDPGATSVASLGLSNPGRFGFDRSLQRVYWSQSGAFSECGGHHRDGCDRI